jgi:hypothetical protein
MDDQFELYYSHIPVSHIYIKWGLKIDENEFRQGMNDLIELMRENETGKILSNNVNMKALSDADQKWSVEDWLPRALAVGYSAIAIIVSKNLFGKMAVEDILNNASEVSPIRIQYFEDEERAKLWLISL